MDVEEHQRLWKQGFVLVEDGCVRLKEDGERCGDEPSGVQVRAGDPSYDIIGGEPRPVVFCSKHHGWPGNCTARRLSSPVYWHGLKVATVRDGPPTPLRINPIPNPL